VLARGDGPPDPPDGGFAAERLMLLGGFATFAGARSAGPPDGGFATGRAPPN